MSKIYGPYVDNNTNRRIIIIDGKTISYAKYLWEQANGPVPYGYEVDHIDDDSMNDCLDNYQLLTKAENIRKHHKSGLIVKLSVRTEEQKEKMRGHNNGMSKLTPEQVAELRLVCPKGGVMLQLYMDKFKVNRRTIENVIKHKSYK